MSSSEFRVTGIQHRRPIRSTVMRSMQKTCTVRVSTCCWKITSLKSSGSCIPRATGDEIWMQHPCMTLEGSAVFSHPRPLHLSPLWFLQEAFSFNTAIEWATAVVLLQCFPFPAVAHGNSTPVADCIATAELTTFNLGFFSAVLLPCSKLIFCRVQS